MERDPTGPAERPLNAMVFQEQSIFPWMSVRDNVAFGLKARGISRRERYAMVEPFIKKVGLAAFADALPHQLSGGMKQRVSIARAFAVDPEILLMDEPFAALDEQTKLVLQSELLRIWEETRKTVLYVTHSIDEAIVLADRIMVMSARPGRIKEIINVDAVFGRPRSVEAVRGDEQYGRFFARIWELLRDEVADSEHREQLGGREARGGGVRHALHWGRWLTKANGERLLSILSPIVLILSGSLRYVASGSTGGFFRRRAKRFTRLLT